MWKYVIQGIATSTAGTVFMFGAAAHGLNGKGDVPYKAKKPCYSKYYCR